TCTPFRSTSRATYTSNHSPVVSLTASGLAMTSLITRSPAAGATMGRLTPEPGVAQWPSGCGTGQAPLTAPGVPKSPVGIDAVAGQKPVALSFAAGSNTFSESCSGLPAGAVP